MASAWTPWTAVRQADGVVTYRSVLVDSLGRALEYKETSRAVENSNTYLYPKILALSSFSRVFRSPRSQQNAPLPEAQSSPASLQTNPQYSYAHDAEEDEDDGSGEDGGGENSAGGGGHSSKFYQYHL
jgi:hypothetical protein